jgi:hypothetical protein
MHFLTVVLILTGTYAKLIGFPKVCKPENTRFKLGDEPGSALNSTPLN